MPMRSSGERRAAERKRTKRDALLSIPRLRGVYSCGVRDLSYGGVGVRLNNLPLLPTEFNLSCQLIWRNGDLAGITFQAAAIDHAQL